MKNEYLPWWKYQQLKPLAEQIDAIENTKENKSHSDYTSRINRVGKIIRVLAKNVS